MGAIDSVNVLRVQAISRVFDLDQHIVIRRWLCNGLPKDTFLLYTLSFVVHRPLDHVINLYFFLDEVLTQPHSFANLGMVMHPLYTVAMSSSETGDGTLATQSSLRLNLLIVSM